MKEIEEYLDQLSINDLLGVYKEYKTAKKTGIYPPGVIRAVAKMLKNVTGNLDFYYAEKMILERFADMWYRQNHQ